MLWVVSRLCEEFGGYPTRALWELQHDPDQIALQILSLRGYAAARRQYRSAENEEAVRKAIAENPTVQTVIDIEHELAAEKLERLKAAAVARALEEDV